MGNEGDFKINITGDASSLVAASEKTDAALQSNKNTLSELTPETKEYIKRLQQGTDASKDMEVSHRNLRVGLHALGPEFSEIGHLGIAAFSNPLTAALLGVGVLAGKLISDWHQTKEAIESKVDVSGIDNVTEALGHEGMWKALIEGGTAADEFWSKINRLITGLETLKEKTDDAVAAQKKDSAAGNKTLDAKEKADLAELRAAKAQGKVSAGEYEIRKGEIEDRYAGQRSNRRALGEDAEIDARRHEREVDQRIVAEGPDIITPKQIAADEAKARLEGQKGELEHWKKSQADIADWFQKKGPAAMGSAEGRAAYAEQEKAASLAIREIVAREGGTIPESEKRAKATAEDLIEAQRKIGDAQKRVKELDREIPKMEGDRSRNRAADTEEAGSNRRIRVAGGEEALANAHQKVIEANDVMIKAAEAGTKVSAEAIKGLERVTTEYGHLLQRVQRLEGMPPPI